MHVSGFTVDLNLFLQVIVAVFVIALGVLHLVRNTASKYFVVDASFADSASSSSSSSSSYHTPNMPGFITKGDACVVCGDSTTKQCAGCKLIRYCSEACQISHWKSGHRIQCKDFQSGKMNSSHFASLNHGRRLLTAVALAPASGTSKTRKQLKKILFSYEDFVELFNWNKPGFPPCGLLNCGNSCFANVILQCLAYTRPLVAYLVERGHKKECRRNDWCFLCEFQTHVERASKSSHPFSPINVLSRLPNIGGNLGYGKQEDAHEFMRFAIDTMQSVCLDEFGGEKALHPSSQETTLIQYIFGGHFQSQVVCTKCNNVSNQHENMMDLTVEIQGDAASLEECLDQFTVRERLHGDNMYRCDGCNDYVTAWKRLTIRRAPNILTIALKRFQSGRFGKLNKRVTFPETLDLRPYMSEPGDGNDIYKLYAVVVHVDMLNASFFGHYICYAKDLCGNWYRIDDCKVSSVELDEVLLQGAYMLLYSRVCARPSSLKAIDSLKKEENQIVNLAHEVDPCQKRPVELSNTESMSATCIPDSLSQPTEDTTNRLGKDSSFITSVGDVRKDVEMVDSGNDHLITENTKVCPGVSSKSAGEGIGCRVEHVREEVVSGSFSKAPEDATSSLEKYSSFITSFGDVREDIEMVDSGDYQLFTQNTEVRPSLYSESAAEETGCPVEYAREEVFGALSSVVETRTPEAHFPNYKSLFIDYFAEDGDRLEKTGSQRPLPSHNCFVDMVSSSDGGTLNEMNSLESKNKPEKTKSHRKNMLPEDTTGKFGLVINSSRAKLKPLFPVGFLGKRPHAKLEKKDGNGLLSEQHDNLNSACELPISSGSNGFAAPYCPQRQNGGERKDVDESVSDFHMSSSSAISLEEQAGKCLSEDEESFLSQSGQSLRLCNGDASDETIMSDISKIAQHSSVRKSFSSETDAGLGATITYGEKGSDSERPVEGVL